MKLYILTSCAAEENYTPEVYKTKKEAVAAMKNYYKECTEAEEAVDSSEIYKDHAEIIYTDDTYDCLQIFEVEVDL